MTIISSHRRPFRPVLLVAVVFLVSLITISIHLDPGVYVPYATRPFSYLQSTYDWSQRQQRYPVKGELQHLPSGTPRQLKKIQHEFGNTKGAQEYRRKEVKNTFKKCWDNYRKYAWRNDELTPVSLSGSDTFAGWGATLVDSLDALIMMDMKTEFNEAVHRVAHINWDSTGDHELCSLFETTIRYLGGLLSAYDLSNEPILLRKATELGHMLYNGFDTPNRMPANSFHFQNAKNGELQPSSHEISANVGSLSMEFTRLAQLTGDPKFYDAIDRVKRNLQSTQDKTKLPGMWPTFVDVANGFLTPDSSFTLGSMADSLYEYLPKMYALLGGLDESYKDMYIKAKDTAKKNLLFRPMLPDPDMDILFSGKVLSNGVATIDLVPQTQHLTCFVGGMFAMGGKLFNDSEDVAIGERLARGCAWAYKVMPTHIMPEEFALIPCREPNLGKCAWDEERWEKEGSTRLPKGFSSVHAPGYMLRPEAIESVFYLYRITGEEVWRDTAWEMFLAIRKVTDTGYANSAIRDVTRDKNPEKLDSMEVSDDISLSLQLRSSVSNSFLFRASG